MPWVSELFSAPALARPEDKRRRDELVAVPYFAGLIAGAPDALVKSFAGEPELHDPVRGRIRRARAFEAFVIETNAWLDQRNVSVEDVEQVVSERRGFEEVDRRTWTYHSSWPLTGRHANRPPLLQPDPELRESDVVAE